MDKDTKVHQSGLNPGLFSKLLGSESVEMKCLCPVSRRAVMMMASSGGCGVAGCKNNKRWSRATPGPSAAHINPDGPLGPGTEVTPPVWTSDLVLSKPG